MKAKLLKFDKSAPTSKHPVVIHKPQSRKTPHAVTVAGAAAAAEEEDITAPGARTRTKPSHHQKQRSGRRHHHQPQPNPHPHLHLHCQSPQNHQHLTAMRMMSRPKKIVQIGERRRPSPRCSTSIKRRSLLSGGGSTQACMTKVMKHTEGR